MGAHTRRSLRGVVGSAATDAEDELSTALPSTGRNYCGAPHGRTRKRWRGSIPCWAVAMLLGDGECIKNNNDQKTYTDLCALIRCRDVRRATRGGGDPLILGGGRRQPSAEGGRAASGRRPYPQRRPGRGPSLSFCIRVAVCGGRRRWTRTLRFVRCSDCRRSAGKEHQMHKTLVWRQGISACFRYPISSDGGDIHQR